MDRFYKIDALEERDRKRWSKEILDYSSKITIRTEFNNAQSIIASESYSKPSKLKPNHSIVIRIIDNGCSMSETVKSCLFAPFFTTKFW